MTTVAGAFKAGTVFVDVVPSLKGFYRDVSSTVRAQLEIGRASCRERV